MFGRAAGDGLDIGEGQRVGRVGEQMRSLPPARSTLAPVTAPEKVMTSELAEPVMVSMKDRQRVVAGGAGDDQFVAPAPRSKVPAVCDSP